VTRSSRYDGADEGFTSEAREVRLHLRRSGTPNPRLVIQDLNSLNLLGASLSERDARELALAILGEQFDIHYDGPADRRTITLSPKLPKVELGQFYMVHSTSEMMVQWQNNPLARVVSIEGDHGFTLETEAGDKCLWYRENIGEELEGPIKVESRWTIVD
jgi:hypothetical protein